MHIVTQWEQAPMFDPTNPNQIIREPNNIGIPGGAYGSFYFNKQPTTVGQVLGGLSGFSTLPPWAQSLIVGTLAATAGWLGMKHLGPKLGLSGPRHMREKSFRRSTASFR